MEIFIIKMGLKYLLKEKSFKVVGSLWIESEEQRFLGPGRVELLERIVETGSINQAAKHMGMSYKKAWGMVNSLNTQAKVPLVITQIGGEKGGGTIITEEAKELIAYYHLLRERFKQFLEEESQFLAE